MVQPTGKLKFAYETIANMEQKIKQLKVLLNSSMQIMDVERMKELALDEMQSSFDSDGYNGCGDGSHPLIDLESAKCALEHIDTTQKQDLNNGKT